MQTNMKKLACLAALVPLILFSCTGNGGEKSTERDVPVVGAVTVSDITYTSAQAVFEVEYDGAQDITTYLCYSVEPGPDADADRLKGDGIFLLENLLPGTRYYVRGCAEAAGEYYYGPQSDFTTQQEQKPVYLNVSDLHAEDMTGTTAVVKYVLQEDGIKQTGVCWKEYGTPTVEDSVCEGEPSSGGEVVIDIEGLNAERFYRLRAYAVTENDEVLYSENIIGLYNSNYSPSFKLGEVVITSTFASIGYVVSATGGWKIVQKGVCLTTSGTPDIEDEKTEDGDGSWWVVTEFGGLEPETTYYMRLYAVVSPDVDPSVRLVKYGEIFEVKTGKVRKK